MEYQHIITNIKSGVIQTPAYIFDIDTLRTKVATICEILGDTAQMCYAIKANPFLLNCMDDMVEKYEVCSPGELEICRNCHIPMKKVVFSGINKTAENIRTAARYGVGVMTVESMHQFDLISQYAAQARQTIQVILRLTNGSQFGINEQDIEQLVARQEQYPFVHMLGVQYFTGTQKKKSDHIIEELDYAGRFCQRLREAFRFDMEVFEYGTGLCVPYFTGDSFEGEYDDLIRIRDYFASRQYPYQVVLEMGRFPVASCGYFATRAEDCKTNKEANYCIIDGGIHHINYYGQNMALKTPVIDHLSMHELKREAAKKWMLCGSLCTFNDVVARNFPVRDLRIGDYFVFHNIGAYAVTEGGYLFLSRDLPNIYFADDQNGIRLVRKGIPTHVLNTPDFSGRRLDTPDFNERRTESPSAVLRAQNTEDATADSLAGSDSVFSDSVFSDPAFSEPGPGAAAKETRLPGPSPLVEREREKDAQAPRLNVPSDDDGLNVIPLARQNPPARTVSRPAHTPKRFVPEVNVKDQPGRRSSRRTGERHGGPDNMNSERNSSRRPPDRQTQKRREGEAPRRSSATRTPSRRPSSADSPERSHEPSGRGARRSSGRRRRARSLMPALIGAAAILVTAGAAFFMYLNGRVLKDIDVEAGSHVMVSDLLRYDSDKDKNQIPLNIDTQTPGDYPVEIRLSPLTYKATVHVKDTKAPEVSVKAVTIPHNGSCSPEDFIENITDASAVTAAFAAQPDFTVPGDQEVRLIFTDAAGNVTNATATLTVGEALPFDDQAPTVYADDIHVIVGGTVSYKKAIRVSDNVDHEDQLTITPDNSQVNLNAVGDYPYTVTVTDRNGNSASASAMVHVLEEGSKVADIDEVNALADAILAEIIEEGMEPKEKLRAIYDWIRSNTRYSGHAQEEDYTLGAYEGFTDHAGDCFTYAAQAKFLLTRAGIDNIDVVKVVPEGATDIPTHFWNLVNIGEGWYHLDCTPRKDGSKFFYLTDEELAKYSDANNGTHVFDHSLYPEIQ